MKSQQENKTAEFRSPVSKRRKLQVAANEDDDDKSTYFSEEENKILLNKNKVTTDVKTKRILNWIQGCDDTQFDNDPQPSTSQQTSKKYPTIQKTENNSDLPSLKDLISKGILRSGCTTSVYLKLDKTSKLGGRLTIDGDIVDKNRCTYKSAEEWCNKSFKTKKQISRYIAYKHVFYYEKSILSLIQQNNLVKSSSSSSRKINTINLDDTSSNKKDEIIMLDTQETETEFIPGSQEPIIEIMSYVQETRSDENELIPNTQETISKATDNECNPNPINNTQETIIPNIADNESNPIITQETINESNDMNTSADIDKTQETANIDETIPSVIKRKTIYEPIATTLAKIKNKQEWREQEREKFLETWTKQVKDWKENPESVYRASNKYKPPEEQPKFIGNNSIDSFIQAIEPKIKEIVKKCFEEERKSLEKSFDNMLLEKTSEIRNQLSIEQKEIQQQYNLQKQTQESQQSTSTTVIRENTINIPKPRFSSQVSTGCSQDKQTSKPKKQKQFYKNWPMY